MERAEDGPKIGQIVPYGDGCQIQRNTLPSGHQPVCEGMIFINARVSCQGNNRQV